MNKTELKEQIKVKVAEIKEMKATLRQNHQVIGIGTASSTMYNLFRVKHEVRVMYLIYGWFRGKNRSDIENAKKHDTMYMINMHAKRILGENYDSFNDWMKSTS